MSRFVSENDPNAPAAEDDSAWIAAQKVLDAKKLSKQETGTQEGGKSLYETLQANKAAKQEAFEESTRLKNQFRTLDEDEADFLESVLASTRKKEAEERKETVEQLAAFRAQQEAAEKSLAQQSSADDEGEVVQSDEWKTGSRKRKKQQHLFGGIKKRASAETSSVGDVKSSSDHDTTKNVTSASATPSTPGQAVKPEVTTTSENVPESNVKTTQSAAPEPKNGGKPGLGLADYSSDDD